MKPLTQFEMHELMRDMGKGETGAPVGSLWTAPASPSVFYLVLLHANLPTAEGPMSCLVMQAIPSGEAWIQPVDQFNDGDWQSIGFIWDRDNAN